MTRRLLRTITVTTTVTESWTLAWNDAAPGEPPTVRCYTQSRSRRFTSAATVVHIAQEFTDTAAHCAGSNDTSPTARPSEWPSEWPSE